MQSTALKNTAQFAWQTGPAARRLLDEMARQRTEEARRVGRFITELRERHHLTQQVAADKLKIAVRTYQAWESGESVPRWHNRVKLGELYRIDPAEILGPPSPTLENGQLNRIEARLSVIERRLARLTPEEEYDEIVGEIEDEEPPGQRGEGRPPGE